jgi:hypothetical protein
MRRTESRALGIAFGLLLLHEGARLLFLLPHSLPWGVAIAVGGTLFVVVPFFVVPKPLPWSRVERAVNAVFWLFTALLAGFVLFVDGVGYAATAQLAWIWAALLPLASLVLMVAYLFLSRGTQERLVAADSRDRPGRRPSPATQELRRRLQADHATGRLNEPGDYVAWMAERTGRPAASVRQTVYRELRLINKRGSRKPA